MKITLYMAIALGFLLLVFDLSSFSQKKPSVEVHKVSRKVSSVSDVSSQSQLLWDTPSTWVTGKASSMRIGSYQAQTQVAGKTETVDISVIKLRGTGGGDLANLNRWRSQVGLTGIAPEAFKKYYKTLHGAMGDFIYVKVFNNAQPSSAILGAMIPVRGDMVYVKMAGTLKALQQLESEFISFATSVKVEGDSHGHK